MRPASKWITDIGPDDATGDVAQQIMSQRLGAVAHYAPLAALEAPSDIEHVHQLRVWTRRSAAASSLFSAQLPPKHRRWLKKQLRAIRRAAGPARDDDVLLMRLQAELLNGPNEPLAKLVETVSAHREEAQSDLLAMYKKYQRKSVSRRFDKTVSKTRWRGDEPEPDYRTFARQSLARACKKFFAAAAGDLHDISQLHALRIEGKRLRYALELLAPAFDAALKKRVYSQVETLQELLGTFNDHAVAAARFRGCLEQENDAPTVELLAEMISHEERQLDSARQDFFVWFSPKRRTAIHDRLVRYCSEA